LIAIATVGPNRADTRPASSWSADARQRVGGRQPPVGLGEAVGVDQVADRGHVGDLEEHPDRRAQGQDRVQQPHPRAGQPGERDQRVQEKAREVAAGHQGAPVDPVDDDPGDGARGHRGGAGDGGEQAHLGHRTGRAQHQQGHGHVGEGVPGHR
jgi:hypothetical protein